MNETGVVRPAGEGQLRAKRDAEVLIRLRAAARVIAMACVSMYYASD